MTELAGDRPKPKPPSGGMVIAVLLELSIVATFVAHHSYVGLALCGAYSWFSASWQFFTPPKE